MCFLEGVGLRRVTIIPDAESKGSASHANPLQNAALDLEATARDRWRMEKLVRISLAGAIAERRFNPRSHWRLGSESDLHSALDLLSYFTGSNREIEAYLALLSVQTEEILAAAFNWAAVKAVAAALIELSHERREYLTDESDISGSETP